MLALKAFPSGPFETNGYVVWCDQTRACAIIDPAPESAESLSEFISQFQLEPKMILLTHSHWDHTADVAPLKKGLNLPVYIHELDQGNLVNPGSDGLPLWVSIEGVEPDHFLQDGEKIQLGNEVLEVIHTPGHTPGGVCFFDRDSRILISGDTLFKGSIGNLSFPTARPELMWSSLDLLAKLPKETKVYPGHGPSTTIGAETWLPKARELFGD